MTAIRKGGEPLLLAVLLLGLPAAGVLLLTGRDLAPYLEFPPRTHYVAHAPFAWGMFAATAAVALLLATPLALGLWRGWRRGDRRPAAGRFPWWGWAALALGTLGWWLAWTRQPWFAPLQRHTFTPLWLAYILAVNALDRWRSGRCLMLDRPRFFLLLFPASALFWWFFEYLNRFVQNWFYEGVADFGPGAYVLLATISFSTVLPAVLSTRDFLLRTAVVDVGFAVGPRLTWWRARPLGALLLAVAAAGLLLVGVLPDFLYPLLWGAPLLLIVGWQLLHRRPTLFDPLAAGDWRPLAAAALAALICGVFWETWNWHSLAKWVYAVPFVGRFHIFEMPLLGYAGYLPFGLECAAIGAVLPRFLSFSQQPDTAAVRPYQGGTP